MNTIHVREKTGKDGALSLRIPLGQPETEFEVVVVVQPAAVLPVVPLTANPWAAVDAIRNALAATGQTFSDSTEDIREDRNR